MKIYDSSFAVLPDGGLVLATYCLLSW